MRGRVGSFIGFAVNYHGDFMRNKRIGRKKQTESTSILNSGLTAPPFFFFLFTPTFIIWWPWFLKALYGQGRRAEGWCGGKREIWLRRWEAKGVLFSSWTGACLQSRLWWTATAGLVRHFFLALARKAFNLITPDLILIHSGRPQALEP